ncbi:isocitrate/isopropylmalate family dehydrogenase [Williamsia herbipolensis]|uniref:Isocitrate/isopropylmalate family dehydrogenase n=1 Tax=Williamsia herbipolensis TaxID=1603258 RepID=A0AAU4K7A2_9NOCA|nr:isocitrate/isopropylmalate family dehydrogenase [Williamsia herbipolensis]
MTGRRIDVVTIPGDGIGPDLLAGAVAVMRAAAGQVGVALDIETIDAGAKVFSATGSAFPADRLDRLRAADGVLKGPVGLPEVRHPDGTEAGVLGGILRTGLDTYANVRPVRLLPGIAGATRHAPGEIDYVIVRENTEGLYLSRGNGVATAEAAVDQLMVTRVGVERVARFAFELARTRAGAPSDGVRRVTCVDKSNVLRSYALFRSVFDDVAEQYPDIAAEHLYADAAAHDLVVRPGRFDVLVMENFLGDILSDLGAGTVGGLGMCASGNIGEHAAYFEPIHGSAPDIAGTDRANPISQILSAALLFDHAGVGDAADLIRTAVVGALGEATLRIGSDGCPVGGTAAAVAEIVRRIDAARVAPVATVVSWPET